MHKKNFFKIIIILVFIVNSFSFCFAKENHINTNIKNNDEYKKELLLTINECVNEIKTDLKKMDKILEQLDQTEEYEKYPAIRLNIDTPFFGLNSMIDNKLKIKNDVSTVDVAQGYSIKDIVNNNIIKLPDFKVGNIVVSTRDVKFDDNISVEDAKSSIFKLVQYISQTKNTSEILKKRINNIFERYIPEEKSKKIEEMNNKLEEISSNIRAKDNDILTIKLLNSDENSKKLIDKYYDINTQVYHLEKSVNNVLLNDEEIKNIEKNLVNLELNTTSYLKDINNEITKLTIDIDIQTLLKNTKVILEEKQSELDEYVDKSIIKEQVNLEEDNEENNDNINTDTVQTTRYEVTSKYIIDYEKSLLNNLYEKIKYYIPENTQEDTESIKPISVDEKKSVLEDVIKLYNDYLEKENKFYLDNLNYMLRDTTYKLAKLPEYTDAKTVKDVEYIYISLPEEINILLDEYNTKSSMQIEALTRGLKDRLLRIIDSNIKVNEEYIEFNKS